MGKESETKTIFIIDDNEMTLQALETLLESRDRFYIKTFLDPIKALDTIKSVFPDLVIIDFEMPGMNGLELAEKIKRLSRKITVILHTATPEDQLLGKTVFDTIIQKGIHSLEKLLSAIFGLFSE